jgi:uncharacterized protein (DUF2147 family)
MTTAGPVAAASGEMSPEGVWALPNQKSRYEFSYCGDGTQLCAEVVWMAPGKDRPKYESEMGKTIIDRAKRKGASTWVGKIRIKDQEADGTIKQVAPDKLHIKACQYFVVCAEFDLVPPVEE